jgi:hypothetical protein
MDLLFDEIEILLVHAAVLKDRSAQLTMRLEESTYRSKHLQRSCASAIEAAAQFLTPIPLSPHRQSG